MTTYQREKVLDENSILENLPKLDRKGIAALALFGLIQALIDPPSLAVFAEAQRIVFTESVEFSKIATVFSVDSGKLRKNCLNYLEKSGVKCQGDFCH